MTTSVVSVDLLLLLLGVALAYDIRTRRIPNWLVLSGLIGGVGCNLFPFQWTAVAPATSFVVFSGLDSLGFSLLGALSGLTVLLPLYLLGVMGAGDAKLMAAIGAFLGPLQVIGAALLTFAGGGVLALLATIGSRSLPRVLGNLRLMTFVVTSGRASGLRLRDVGTTGRLPYAIAIAFGTLLQLYLAGRGHWPFA
jgi:prepilin peptidase CpaA